ncbi:uncharacterized protein LOC9658586 isoform X1 [Selaginella moellendorffii]|uniref:uncharacterized protein LOC9658586 isoform X1 n=1 Tax=Selaginella moellendorffii TaxID=88036 RepID=UPI000D1CC96E|nr:uncharacterized protein LOC9658586 isoform X1 [Selaginella moellendorffii]|eukprot:XP_024529852.1 uncharacterized protein LOC9658586 isoform X1 [Selaginella moellendorffii]
MRRSCSQQSLSDLLIGAPAVALSPQKKCNVANGRNGIRRLRKNTVVKILARLNRASRKSSRGFALASRRCSSTPSSPKVVSIVEKVRVRADLSCLVQCLDGSKKDHRDKLVLLNLLAALYGLGNVISKFVDAGAAPATLNSAVKYASASLVFLPFLIRSLKSDDGGHIRAGVELSLWTFAHSLLSSSSPRSTDMNAASLLYALTVLGIPVMQLYAGRSSKVTWLAITAALLGMGLLEEEGAGWKGILLPSCDSTWAIVEASFSILQLLRSESLGRNRDPVRLNAIQLSLLSILNAGVELSHLNSWTSLVSEAQTLPWCPLLFSGLVCVGLGSLLEMRGLRGVNSSTIAMSSLMIPVWGAFFSLLEQGRSSQEIALLSGMVLTVARLSSFFMHGLLHHRDDEEEDNSNSQQSSQKSGVRNHLPVMILSCQLKYPYYVNQAQALLGDVDSSMNSSLELLENTSFPDHQQREIYQVKALHDHLLVGASDGIQGSGHADYSLVDTTVHIVTNFNNTFVALSVSTLQTLASWADSTLTIFVS